MSGILKVINTETGPTAYANCKDFPGCQEAKAKEILAQARKTVENTEEEICNTKCEGKFNYCAHYPGLDDVQRQNCMSGILKVINIETGPTAYANCKDFPGCQEAKAKEILAQAKKTAENTEEEICNTKCEGKF